MRFRLHLKALSTNRQHGVFTLKVAIHRHDRSDLTEVKLVKILLIVTDPIYIRMGLGRVGLYGRLQLLSLRVQSLSLSLSLQVLSFSLWL